MDTSILSSPRVKQRMVEQVGPIGTASLPSRLGRLSMGMATAGARYLTQRVPTYLRHRDQSDVATPDLERDLPGDPTTVQRARDGLGPLYHRSYCVYVTDEELGPEQLISFIAADPNRVTPVDMARFETVDGQPVHGLDLGDEMIVRLPGPWDGPVRVIGRTPTSFRFVTLQGHMEAGEIEFAASYDERGFLRFQIDSWTRSGDRLFHLLYQRFPLGREMQAHMWSQFCMRVAEASNGVRMSNISAATRQLD